MSAARNPVAEVISWASTTATPEILTPKNGTAFDLEAFIALHLRVRRGPFPWNGSLRKWELEVCPFNPEHTGGCAVITQGANGRPGFKCQHNGCTDKHWREVRELFDGAGETNKLRPESRAQMTDVGLLNTRCLADIEAKPVRWLWPGRVARGKLTIIAGNPGLGKSQITASIAAVVTTGGRWPVDRQQSPHADVLFLTAEDDPADTLRPRLEAAGADLARVHVIDGVIRGYTGDGGRKSRAFSLEDNLQALEAKLAELGDVAVVVIDPITAYLGNTDSHKNADVRALLAPLGELAARHNVAIIGVSHLSKAAGMQALMRVSGSLAFVAAARAAYLVATDPQDKTRRLFLPLKNNLGPDATGLAFRIEGATVASPAGTLTTSRVCWETEPVSISADQALQAECPPERTTALDVAKEWLQDALAYGPLTAEDVSDRAKADGVSTKTLQRASKALKVQKQKSGMEGPWSWSLPPKMAKSAEDAQVSDVATFGEIGHLRDTDTQQQPSSAEINSSKGVNHEAETIARDDATSRLGNGGESGQVTRGVR
jgi:putative DNA primase/helicase